jgi:hypothetical protein
LADGWQKFSIGGRKSSQLAAVVGCQLSVASR